MSLYMSKTQTDSTVICGLIHLHQHHHDRRGTICVCPAGGAIIPGQYVAPDGSPHGGGVEDGVGVAAQPVEHQLGQTKVLQLDNSHWCQDLFWERQPDRHERNITLLTVGGGSRMVVACTLMHSCPSLLLSTNPSKQTQGAPDLLQNDRTSQRRADRNSLTPLSIPPSVRKSFPEKKEKGAETHCKTLGVWGFIYRRSGPL